MRRMSLIDRFERSMPHHYLLLARENRLLDPLMRMNKQVLTHAQRIDQILATEISIADKKRQSKCKRNQW